jgi:signal transduction histidine kinase
MRKKFIILNISRHFKTNLKFRNNSRSNEIYENMIHDIQTPLTVMQIIISDFEYDNNFPEDFKPSLSKLSNSWYKITKMIRDTGDIQKINNGILTPNFRNGDMVELLNDIVDSSRPISDRKNIEIVFTSNVESNVVALDKNIIERIVLNVLSNSYKFTNANGKVTIDYKTTGTNQYIRITDTGIGIPRNKLKSIFERHSYEKTVRNKNGSGLGLSIVKEFVLLLNGNIKVNSSDEGTEFIIDLPCFLSPHNSNQDDYFNTFYTDNLVQLELSDLSDLSL